MNTETISNTAQTAPKGPWAAKILARKSAARWMTAAILGGISISSFGMPAIDDSQAIFLRLAIPIVIIVIYTWSGYKDAQSVSKYPILRNARVGQLADAIYFLGFLWTLWALIDSFVIHHLSITEAVFRAFGYALVTTASGMFLRLALLQFSYSAEDQVPVSEQHVEEEIIRFSKAIKETVESLGGFKTQIDAAQSKWVHSLLNSTEVLKTAVDKVGMQTVSLKDALVEMQKINEEHVNKLIESALGQFAQKIQPPLDTVNNTVTKMEGAVNTGVKNIERAVEKGAKQTQDDLSKHSEAINAKLMKSTEAVEKGTASLAESLPKQMASLVSNLADVSKQIRNIHVSPDIVEKTIVQQSVAFSEAFNKTMMASTIGLQKAIDELSRSVVAATRPIRENSSKSWWDKWKFSK